MCKYLPDFQPARMRRFPGSRLCWVRTVVSSPCPVHTGSTPDSLRGQAGTAVPELRHRASGKTHNPDIPKTIGLEIRNESLLSVGTCAESTQCTSECSGLLCQMIAVNTIDSLLRNAYHRFFMNILYLVLCAVMYALFVCK